MKATDQGKYLYGASVSTTSTFQSSALTDPVNEIIKIVHDNHPENKTKLISECASFSLNGRCIHNLKLDEWGDKYGDDWWLHIHCVTYDYSLKAIALYIYKMCA